MKDCRIVCKIDSSFVVSRAAAVYKVKPISDRRYCIQSFPGNITSAWQKVWERGAEKLWSWDLESKNPYSLCTALVSGSIDTPKPDKDAAFRYNEKTSFLATSDRYFHLDAASELSFSLRTELLQRMKLNFIGSERLMDHTNTLVWFGQSFNSACGC